MTFKSYLNDQAADVFLNTNEFAETITYTPYGSTAKSINAVIVRSQLDSFQEGTGRTMNNEAEIYIANDATNGVESVNQGNDQITMNDVSGTSRTWIVIEVIDSDDGMWHLKVGR